MNIGGEIWIKKLKKYLSLFKEYCERKTNISRRKPKAMQEIKKNMKNSTSLKIANLRGKPEKFNRLMATIPIKR